MQFDNMDIVVWNGLITYYAIIKGKVSEDEITLANDIEISLYSRNL
jgi:hypothetical protein